MVLKRFNGLVDELAVWQGVPFEPIACVAIEIVVLKHRWIMGIVSGVTVVTVLVVVIWGFLWRFRLESWVIRDGVVVFMERLIM